MISSTTASSEQLSVMVMTSVWAMFSLSSSLPRNFTTSNLRLGLVSGPAPPENL